MARRGFEGMDGTEEKREIVKVCKVHGELTLENIYLAKGRPGKICIVCKKCKRLRDDGYRRRNWREHSEEYREKQRKQNKSYKEKYPEKVRDIWLKDGKRNREILSNKYIKAKLYGTGFLTKEITNDLIEFKRALLKLKRQLKETKCQNNHCKL